MKYMTFTDRTEQKYGALLGERVIELTGHGFPSTLLEFIKTGEQTWEAAEAYCQSSPPIGLPLSQVRVLAPLPNPGKIVCIGLNYMDHCREQNIKVPERPVVFAKFSNTVTGPYDSIEWDPALTDQVDYEVELGVVIGKTARRVTQEKALDYVFGYTTANDVSARDIQFSDSQWVRGKSLDSFCPFGPVIVTADEIPDPQKLALRTTVNGQVLQDSNTAEMIFSVRELISFLSQAFTLEPGDLILTGTPNGVGVFRKPQIFLRDGDQVTVEVERIGKLENPCVGYLRKGGWSSTS
jgi:2-keto-4-pentenoate hydratase/2-oxohepta-3-ene-1,7-dioic acid hydratase in catechol pathway